MFVANHASYLDVLVLLAVLPPTVRFACEGEARDVSRARPDHPKSGYVQVQRGTTSAAGALAASTG